MRIFGKILATLVMVPLTYLLVVGGWLAVLGDVSPRQAPGIGTMTLMLVVTLLAAIWWPGIGRRWLAALAGGGVALIGSVLTLVAGDIIASYFYSAAIIGGLKSFGPVLSAILAIHLIRRPWFAA